MTNTNSLVSHTETVLGGSKLPNSLNSIRSVLHKLEDAKNANRVEAVVKDFVEKYVTESGTPKAKRQRIELVSAAAGSVLKGMDASVKSADIANRVCKDADPEALSEPEGAVVDGLEIGFEHPWKRDDTPPKSHDHEDDGGEPTNHNSSYHYKVLRAWDEAKGGNTEALYEAEVLGHMANLSAEDLRSDPEIVKVKTEMKAAELSVRKWLEAITEYRRKNVLPMILYTDTSNGKPDPKSRRNVQEYLTQSHTSVWLDEFTNKVYVKPPLGKPVELNDAVLLDFMFALRETKLRIDKDATNDALTNIAQSNKRHAVRDYLAQLEWDREKRIETWLSKYAGARDTELNRAYGRKFLIGAVRRIMEPGVKLRAMPILEGEQNVGKSLVFKTLAVRPEWYTDSLELGCDPKEVIELTEGKWIVETPELSGMARRDVEHVKAMVSRDVDKARLAYGRFSTEVPRQFVLGGTTNTDEYLKDRTGNTRFWGIKVSKPKIKALKQDRDQLWAEAVKLEATGEAHWLDTAELQALAQESVQAREERSPLEEQWIDLLKRAKREGDIFISTDQLYRAAGLEDMTKRLQGHKTSMGFAAKHAGWVSARKRVGGDRPYGFVPDGAEPQTAQTAIFDRILKRFKAEARPLSRANGPR